MAAVDLSAVQTFPRSRVITSIGTNWQEVTLPTDPGCRHVSVTLSAAGKIAWTSNDDASDPADGAASGSTTHKESLAANTLLQWTLGPTNARRPAALFIAADGGTLTATVCLEG